METLLIVLVIGCAVAFVVQVGRGIWARARTVERHQQALDTLAGITQRPDTLEDGSSGLSEHQAHVRLIGPGGQASETESAALPPPRALPSSASPFRRPSLTSPSPTAFEDAGYGEVEHERAGYEAAGYEGFDYGAPASAYSVSPEVTQPTPVSAPQPPVAQPAVAQALTSGPAQGPVPGHESPPGQETMPGLPQQPAPPAPQPAQGGVFVEPPTVPVPIVQPQVFYFDDLSGRAEAPEGQGGKHRRLSRRRRRNDVTAEHLLPALPPPPVVAFSEVPAADLTASGLSVEGRGPSGRGRHGAGGHKSVVGVVLAAAAICVAVVAIGVTIVGLPGHSSPGAQTAGTASPTSAAARSHTTTTVRPKPTTSTTPPKPAVLVSSQNGTATYDLSSPSASIVVTATAPCWYEVRANSPLGQIINEGTLEAGSRFSVTGPAWIRLGNPPAVAVKVDGTPMTVPDSQVGLPLNLQFTLG